MRFFLGWSLLLVGLGPLAAAELDKIDRTIPKLPELKGQARYALLIFGKETLTRVWVLMTDQRLYLDLNANGDLTDPGEMFSSEHRRFHIGAITERDGKTRHTDLVISGGGPNASLQIKIHGQLPVRVFRDRRGQLQFGDQPATAPIIHLNGPITLDSFWSQRPLRSQRAVELSVVVGTPGKGAGTFAMYRCDCFLTKGSAPVADIEFPHRDPFRPPLPQRVQLNED